MKLTAERLLEETVRNEYLSDTLKHFDMFPEDKDTRENSIEILESKIAKAEAEIKELQEEVNTYREALAILKYVSKKYNFRTIDPNTRDLEEQGVSETPDEPEDVCNPTIAACNRHINELRKDYKASCICPGEGFAELFSDWIESERKFLKLYIELQEPK